MSIVKLNNRGVRSATTFGSISSLGSMTFLFKQTASSSSTISFTSGIDSTYKEYLFTFKNIHPQTDEVDFLFQGNAAGGSGYNETITSTQFNAYHAESGSEAGLGYQATRDQAQGTSFQMLTNKVGNGNDEHTSGYLHLFNPSSTTFIKNFVAHLIDYHYQDYVSDNYTAGYFNTTSAIDEIQFKFSSGNIDAGDICLFGIN